MIRQYIRINRIIQDPKTISVVYEYDVRRCGADSKRHDWLFFCPRLGKTANRSFGCHSPCYAVHSDDGESRENPLEVFEVCPLEQTVLSHATQIF